ncbi:MAG: hypothetical protein GY820_25205 [Gammaproteobacteria bacterium]|nr:hypothetical protein [Gammaproteobacteria bacterium]
MIISNSLYRILPYGLMLLALLFPGSGSAAELLAYLSPGPNGYWQVWVLDPTSNSPRQVSKSAYDKATVSWYPDGRRLLINGIQGELATLMLNNGEEAEIVASLKGFYDAELSPDGKHIAFSLSMVEKQGSNDIWVMSVEGDQLRKVTDMAWYQGQPRWGMDSNRLYFNSGRFDQSQDIWVVDLSSGDQRQLTNAQRFHFDVIEGPEGLLLFSGNRSGNYDIWLRQADGKTDRLTEHEALDANPVWSLGNKGIVFESTREGRSQLFSLDLQSRQLQQLTHAQFGARFPRWSQSGEVKQ